MPRHTDTIAAVATPVGASALAVLRASGPDTLRLAGEIVGSPPPPRVARHCDYKDRAGMLVDDVVLTFYQGPRSYTGEDAFEISCHGNPFIVQKILEDLFARGCRPAGPGEFTQRAFLNGRMDLSQAEAVMDVIHARSERALSAANQQLRGALGRRMEGLIESLLGVLARIEAYIDFPEEDLPAEDRAYIGRELNLLLSETERLLATSHYGELLRDGIKAVIVGEPNVGKSSLLNRLVGRDRALVSSEPGTTRDFIEERIIVGPHCLRLIDTAGLNPSPAPLEMLGIVKTRERLAEADLVLLVLDATDESHHFPPELHTFSKMENCLLLFNKSDLGDHKRVVSGNYHASRLIHVSALTGEGIGRLVDAISRLADKFQAGESSDGIAINARHSHSLAEARRGLLDAAAKFGSYDDGIELLASDLRGVLSSFGEIRGKVDNERMLDQLFATF
ncbi:MAG: tRNA uridine-5-carboxymethylaminomethyl(34) synthesis GTPase MnmE, partial [Opitutaceae bacterium]